MRQLFLAWSPGGDGAGFSGVPGPTLVLLSSCSPPAPICWGAAPMREEPGLPSAAPAHSVYPRTCAHRA